MKFQISAWLRRLSFGTLKKGTAVADATPACRVEPLEERMHLSVHWDSPLAVTKVFADNRGQVVVAFNRDANASSINSKTVHIYTAGPDKKFGTRDDVPVTVTIRFAQQVLTVNASLPADTAYRFVLTGGANGVRTTGRHGFHLHGNTSSGNYDIVANRTTDVAHFETVLGNIDVELNATAAPKTVDNFLSYADAGAWDGTFFHRSQQKPPSTNLDIIQGGGFKVTRGSTFASIPSNAAIKNENKLSNVRGTIAMANAGINTATNEWFFNNQSNRELNRVNGGYTVFGMIKSTDKTSLATMDAIAALPRINANTRSDSQSALGELPVRNSATATSLNVKTDLVIVSRVSMLMTTRGTFRA